MFYNFPDIIKEKYKGDSQAYLDLKHSWGYYEGGGSILSHLRNYVIT